MNNIEDLPDDCLLRILENFSIKDLLQFRLINHRCCNLIESYFRRIKTLKLFEESFLKLYLCNIYEKCSKNSKWKEFDTDEFKFTAKLFISRENSDEHREIICFMHRLFPNIENLVIFLTFKFNLAFVLKVFSKTLFSLSIFGFLCWTEQYNEICRQLSTMEHLKRLHLHGTDLNRGLELSKMKPILGRLTHLTVSECQLSIDILKYLGDCCRSITLENVNDSTNAQLMNKFNDIIEQNPQRMNGITHLIIGDHFDYYELLPKICKHFNSLKCLDLRCFIEVPLVNIMDQLSNLYNLTELRLKLRNCALDNFKQLPVIPLLNITILHLYRLCVCHYRLNEMANMKRLQLSKAFPSVQYIHIRTHCPDCLPHLGKFCFDENFTKLIYCHVQTNP